MRTRQQTSDLLTKLEDTFLGIQSCETLIDCNELAQEEYDQVTAIMGNLQKKHMDLWEELVVP